MSALAAPLALVGRWVIGLLAGLGRALIFAGAGLSHALRPPIYPREMLGQIFQIGYLSLPVVGLTAAFTGGALALQIYAGGVRFSVESVVPQIVAIGVVRELGPVMVGLMIAARVTSSVAAEIATMKVTEQIDALVTLSTNPMKYLVAPRLVAGLISVPLLVAVGDVIGIFGGYFVSVTQLDFNASTYVTNTWNFLTNSDMASSLIKGAAFGLIATLMGCYHGMNSERGARGVGRATKRAVEAAAILILAANFLLTSLLFSA